MEIMEPRKYSHLRTPEGLLRSPLHVENFEDSRKCGPLDDASDETPSEWTEPISQNGDAFSAEPDRLAGLTLNTSPGDRDAA